MRSCAVCCACDHLCEADMIKQTLCALVVLLGLLHSSLVAKAEIYRWVDEKGRVQYNDTRPEGNKAKNLVKY